MKNSQLQKSYTGLGPVMQAFPASLTFWPILTGTRLKAPGPRRDVRDKRADGDSLDLWLMIQGPPDFVDTTCLLSKHAGSAAQCRPMSARRISEN